MKGSISSMYLRTAFTQADPKSAIKLLNLTVFFAVLGSARVKAARRTSVKLTLGEDVKNRKDKSGHNPIKLKEKKFSYTFKKIS